ncbi:hypothetical protein [Aquimarina agarivorans]|uniref:hypothetical protein n=1 Tax=Aquimarina agarivorans TaxID=980584 RepID=UPI000248FC45|nr:hypothetical protein [Aquimarina agarivorans]
MTIKQLQALDMSKVQPEPLKVAVTDILGDYDKASSKSDFEEIAKENIEKVFLLVERLAPKAIKDNTAPKVKKKEKKELKTSKPKKASVKKELGMLNEDIKKCRVKIRKFNEEKRKNEPKKPKVMRHTKIKNHFISIANLIPPAQKDNVKMQKEAEKILLRAHRGIMNTYGINFVRAEAGEKAIKEKYDKMEQRATK